ncbi:penicillin acylase family protein [Cecembia sp.]|uniref:penicillin acylase family protein n=1 Tax=Cecembia sp. TaxID=1898110 RepID=UPI0025C313B0|nr:penicillin acylase family protein [Cecembia sp.]
MKIKNAVLFLVSISLTGLCLAQEQTLTISGLMEKVEVTRDQNGINHIFAQNEQDLFFSQGYLAAKDRLFQFEIWRRRAAGTLAEILGDRELERDKGVRLFQFRGNKEQELQHYHPRGVEIVDSFVAGVNAYIQEVRMQPENLPIEFKMLDILPGFWTWETVISRHQGLLQNVQDELLYSRVVSQIGAEKAKSFLYFHPNEPHLEIPAAIPQELLFKDILAPYNAFRAGFAFQPEDVLPEYRNQNLSFLSEYQEYLQEQEEALKMEKFNIGSNNWVISGEFTESGYPIMANDPHRLHAIPSLRYWVGLHAPGWNVVGAGEPVIPGISIGHNEYGAWGLTIFETDNEDLRVYDIHPQKPTQYFYKGNWQDMRIIQDTIKVKGRADEIVKHYYTVHGPVTFIDQELNKAVAVECAWMEPGGAPYLASLRMDQSKTWEEFREACSFNHIPAENMVWADKEGNIGWQSTGINPIRTSHSGLVASLGDGSMDWEGYQAIKERPNITNPAAGFFVTANENVTPEDYSLQHTIGYEWADAFRGDRIREVLSEGRKFTMEEMGALQNDYLSLPARKLVPYLLNLNFEEDKYKNAIKFLEGWDYRLESQSIPAGIYVMWERKLRENGKNMAVPDVALPYVGAIQMTRILEWVEKPEKLFTEAPESARNQWILACFKEAVDELEKKLGLNPNNWQYGQEDYKHASIRHPLSLALSEEWREKLDAGPLPRGGYSFTPAANAYGDNNTSGASFRIVVDTGDWERTMGINTPGQSGDPESPFYKHLFELWANDRFFTVPFGKDKVEKMGVGRLILVPK